MLSRLNLLRIGFHCERHRLNIKIRRVSETRKILQLGQGLAPHLLYRDGLLNDLFGIGPEVVPSNDMTSRLGLKKIRYSCLAYFLGFEKSRIARVFS